MTQPDLFAQTNIMRWFRSYGHMYKHNIKIGFIVRPELFVLSRDDNGSGSLYVPAPVYNIHIRIRLITRCWILG